MCRSGFRFYGIGRLACARILHGTQSGITPSRIFQSHLGTPSVFVRIRRNSGSPRFELFLGVATFAVNTHPGTTHLSPGLAPALTIGTLFVIPNSSSPPRHLCPIPSPSSPLTLRVLEKCLFTLCITQGALQVVSSCHLGWENMK